MAYGTPRQKERQLAELADRHGKKRGAKPKRKTQTSYMLRTLLRFVGTPKNPPPGIDPKDLRADRTYVKKAVDETTEITDLDALLRTNLIMVKRAMDDGSLEPHHAFGVMGKLIDTWRKVLELDVFGGEEVPAEIVVTLRRDGDRKDLGDGDRLTVD